MTDRHRGINDRDIKHRCIIRGLSVLSSLGAQRDTATTVWEAGMRLDRAPVVNMQARTGRIPVFALGEGAESHVREVASDQSYHRLDRTSHMAISAARGTFARLGSNDASTGAVGCISIGSSRGPTMALEQSLHRFGCEGRVSSLTSPTTTAGNISSWVAQEYLSSQDAGAQGQQIAALTTSMTCSSALHSLLVAKSFISSGMARAALFGGSEACLTPYTVAQLEALRIYGGADEAWPSRPFDSEARENAVILGEGAGTALLILTNNDSELRVGDLELIGIGWALESIPSPTGISEDGVAFERAMRMACMAAGPHGVKIGAVVAHAPGTLGGDGAEQRAIERVFGEALIVSTKHLTGHSYGASGMLSLGLAEALLGGLAWPGFPYSNRRGASSCLEPGSVVVVNSAGFGGNAVSVIIGRP
jgi:3-oxoacyl-[acyl-carrier-protein] synthase II